MTEQGMWTAGADLDEKINLPQPYDSWSKCMGAHCGYLPSLMKDKTLLWSVNEGKMSKEDNSTPTENGEG